MKFILISVGTRGDMEPFLAVGNMLQERGHNIICAFPEQFRPIVENAGLEFASLGSQYIELLESNDGKAAMGGSGFSKFLATLRLARNQTSSQKELVRRQCEIVEKKNPDRIIYNGKSVYPILWQVDNPGRSVFLSPLPYMHYVKGHTHVAFNGNYGTFLNKLTFSLANFGLVTTVMMAAKWLGLRKEIKRKDVRKVIATNPAVYTISPELFPRPADWPPRLQVFGFHPLENTQAREPSPELEAFLRKHSGILFITFGSMTNLRPHYTTKVILEVLERNGIPAVINCADGGLEQPEGYTSAHIHFVKSIPYSYILPRVYAVVHHGGSGTTHLGLRHGCPTLIIPHIIDQFVWNQIIADNGFGPKGTKIGKINIQNLEPLVLDLMQNPVYRENTRKVAEKMAEEDLGNRLCEFLTDPLPEQPID